VLVRQYAAALPSSGDAQKGVVLFRQNCSVCHRLHGEGTEIGPDLAMVTGKPSDVLLTALLDPNQAVESRYIGYNVTTRNGRELSGIISAETPTSITLRSQGGVEEVLLRSDITEMRSSGLSLMPEGLEKALKPQDLADLIAFLRGK
jgi:putative heme-binding domain-containing protein